MTSPRCVLSYEQPLFSSFVGHCWPAGYDGSGHGGCLVYLAPRVWWRRPLRLQISWHMDHRDALSKMF